MKKLLIAVSVVALLAAGVFGLYVHSDYSFSFIETYKKNFSDNILNLKIRYELKKAQKEEEIVMVEEPEEAINKEEIVASEEPEEEFKKESIKINYTDLVKEFVTTGEPIALNGAQSARFENYMGGMLCVVENSIIYYNKNAKAEWNISIQMSNPVLKVKGSYYLLFEQNGTKVALFSAKRKLFLIETKEKILTGDLSSTGDCAILTEKKYYKGAVEVLNKSGLEIYSRSFGKNSAMAVAISNSRRLCVSLLSMEDGVSSKIMFLDLNKKEEDLTVSYDNSVIFDLEFAGNVLHAFADDRLVGINDNGKQIWKYDYKEKTLSKYANDGSNIRLMLFDANNSAELSVVTASGKEKQRISEDIAPDFCDISDGYILYNGGRSLYLTKSNGTPLAKFVASRDMKKAYFIDSDNILVVYSSSIEFLHIEKGE